MMAAGGKRRARGQGRVFQRPGSAVWWIAYNIDGKEIRESSGSRDRRAAERKLDDRLKRVAAHQIGALPFLGPKAERVRVGELLDALDADYRLRRVRALASFLSHLKPIRQHFGHWRAVSVTAEAVVAYITERREEGKADATINRETQLLSQAMRLGVERKRIMEAPKIEHLKEDNAREGFFERPELEALVAALPDYLKDCTRFGYVVGMRRSEIIALHWNDVDRDGGEIRLPGRKTKNGRPKKIMLDADLAALIARRAQARLCTSPDGNPRVADRVFHRGDGEPVGDFRKAWASACAKVGLVEPVLDDGGQPIHDEHGKVLTRPSKLFHDLRRTAVRNMVRAGVPERVAMEISGHRTRSIFDRYNITSEDDLREAAQRTAAYVNALPTEVKVVPIRHEGMAR